MDSTTPRTPRGAVVAAATRSSMRSRSTSTSWHMPSYTEVTVWIGAMARLDRGVAVSSDQRLQQRGRRLSILGIAAAAFALVAVLLAIASMRRAGDERNGLMTRVPAPLTLIVSGDTAGWIVPCGC